MNTLRISLIIMVASTLGCAALNDTNSLTRTRLTAIDGLERADISLPGVLELRDGHHIGSYDGFLLPAATLSYERGSAQLTRRAERIFLELLRESLVARSAAAEIPIHDEPGTCVMEIGLAVIHLNLDVADRADQLVELTMVMQFRDSMSREPLLRYAKQDRVPNPSEGASQDAQLRQGLDRIITEMNISGAFRISGLADDEINPGCNGTLADRGRAAAAQN
jgi:hypothetical protein